MHSIFRITDRNVKHRRAMKLTPIHAKVLCQYGSSPTYKRLTLHVFFFLVRTRSWTFQITSLNKIIADKNVHAQHKLPLELMDKKNSTYYVFCRKCVNLSSSCRKLFGIDQTGGNAISYTINNFCNKYLYMLQAL